MEYDNDKSPTATTFSRKMSNRSHSLSFSANAIYDGVFSSSANKKSPLVDYGEIFRVSGPSPSSIPFLDVPELNGGKVKVDVRSSKLDYSSVFGGFGDCDFAVTPKEVVIKSERKTAKNEDKRNRRKAGSSSDVHLCNEEKSQISSPDMVRMKHSDISHHQTVPPNANGTAQPIQVSTVAGPTQLVDTILHKIETKTSVPSVEKSVEKKPCNVSREEIKASRKLSSKTEVDFQKIFGGNECSTRDNSPRKTNSNAEHWDVKPPQNLQSTFSGEIGASEMLMGSNSGLPERFQTEDADSPRSPSFFDAESDANSSAAESSAALKKAIEEAQIRMNIAKQMMERKKSGFRSCARLISCDDRKVENKDIKVEGITIESKENNSQIPSEMVNSSEQSFPNEGDQHAKRARKLWEVPEGLLKSTSDQKCEEITEQEVVNLEEEQARRARKHWELPGGVVKSVMNSKQQETENLAPAKPETDTEQEVQPLTENSFYTFGQLGSKIKCVLESITGSKVSQMDETHVTEKENSILPDMVQDKESDSQGMLPGVLVMETYLREVEETPQQIESKSKTKVEEKTESKMCTSTEECSHKMEEETEWQVEKCCKSEDGPKCGEKEIVSRPQEMLIDPDDTKTYVREVEEIPTPNQSLSKTQFDESVGTMVSFVTENTPEPGNIHEETEHMAPRRRRVWKTSEDVYNMIKVPKGNSRPWHLESLDTETTQRSFQMEGVRICDASEETESRCDQASDSGLQENWTVLKQMFRQMFQTADTTKGEDETYCLLESEKEYIDIHKKAGDENGKETAQTSYSQMAGTDKYEQNEVETVELEHDAYTQTRENEDWESTQETYCREEDDKVEVQGKTFFVRELIGEELDAIGMASSQEGEGLHEVFEEAGWAQELSEFDEKKEHADSHSEMLEYDRSETDSKKFGEKFEQTRELAEEIKIDGSIDTDTSQTYFEMRQDDSYIDEVGIEQDLSDQFHEKNNAASSTEEHVEEIDSDSIQSGWSVLEDEENIKCYVEESLAGHLQNRGASRREEIEETKEETDEIEISLGEENMEPEHRFECQKQEMDRNNVEPADSSCWLPNGDEKIGAATNRNVKDNDGDESYRSEEGDAASDASQNEAERVEKHLKKKDEAKEKEREKEKERFMVERAIREARERAFADARERAGKAAMEKAKAGIPRRGTSEVPRRSEKGSVEVNDKVSSAEKALMQAKLRAERAAVERALSEARERALEKALSSKSAASQTRSYGGSKSFGSSGERRGSSSSQGTENKSSGASNSTNQSAKGEPIQRCKARSERQQRTSECAAEALAEKKLRDLKAQKEQAERNRLAESLDADVKRWSSGKESNLRALLSTLQYILGAESGWKPIPLTDLVSSASVRKAYRKATLYVHPDKLQQRGASTQQKYICEKVFDLLKEAWNKFGADER